MGLRFDDTEVTLSDVEPRLRDLEPLMQALGALVVSEGQRAFDEQESPDGREWEQRYPNQRPFEVNVAGLVADLLEGETVKDRRFDERPAGQDSGDLRNTLTAEVRGNSVEVGSPLEYADRIQRGGTSTQRLTREMRRDLAKFLRSAKGRPLRDRLGFLFAVEELETQVGSRPFLVVTPELETQMAQVTETYLATGRPF